MPRRGYRKGLSDSKEPLPRFVRTRLSEREFCRLMEEGASRGVTTSKLVRSVVLAHLKGQRMEAAQRRGVTADLVRQFARIGNNLNQLARQANVGLVAVSAEELRACTARLNELVRTL